MKSNKAFTKTDLLVLILGVAFLLANLGAIGPAGRQRAKDALCLSNLRQWGIVFEMYTNDNEGLMPASIGGNNNYLVVTLPYVKNEKIRLCPTATRTMEEGAVPPFAAIRQRPEFLGSYGLPDWVISQPSSYPERYWKTPYVSNASEVPMFFDCARLYLSTPHYSDAPPYFQEDIIFSGGEMKNFCLNRHNGAVQGAFLDFSARKVGLKELWVLPWNRVWDQEIIAAGSKLPVWPAWMQNFKDY